MESLLVSTLVVAIAEIGDKTQLLAIVLACRFRKPWPIIAGILVATMANHALAALAGYWISSFLQGFWFKVLIALGSPSTTGTFGNEVFYYISQTRHRDAKFMADKVVDQHVVAIYFDDKQKVARIANYGMKDGKIFDFVSQTTPTGGLDRSFLQQVFAGLIGFSPGTIGQ